MLPLLLPSVILTKVNCHNNHYVRSISVYCSSRQRLGVAHFIVFQQKRLFLPLGLSLKINIMDLKQKLFHLKLYGLEEERNCLFGMRCFTSGCSYLRTAQLSKNLLPHLGEMKKLSQLSLGFFLIDMTIH